MDRDLQGALDFFLKLEPIRLQGLKLALDGDLGAGKTYFVRSFLEALSPGSSAQAASPSFGLAHQYQGGDFLVDHFDLYRLEDPSELEEIGLFEALSEPGRIALVEWAQLFESVYSYCQYRLLILEEQGRRVYRIQSIEIN